MPAALPHRVSAYTGIDLVPDNIVRMREHIAEERLCNVTAEIGDATDLTGLADDAFDVVLCLGPMYHLSPDDLARAMAECQRHSSAGRACRLCLHQPSRPLRGGRL